MRNIAKFDTNCFSKRLLNHINFLVAKALKLKLIKSLNSIPMPMPQVYSHPDANLSDDLN